MIPQFPIFKKIDSTDELEIRSRAETKDMALYSDFSFVSMWVWDTANDMKISLLHDNLVVMFRDYTSHEAFLSFIGTNNLIESTHELITYSKQHFKVPRIRLVPGEIALKLPGTEFTITPDESSYDYVYEVSHLAAMDQWKSDKKKKIEKFLKKHPQYDVRIAPLNDAPVAELINLFERWGKNKNHESIFELNEFHSFQRLLKLKNENIYFMLFLADGMLHGFTVYEIIGDRTYAISHYAKADTQYDKDIYDIMNWEEAKILQNLGITYYNWEQDLGIPELRHSKMRYEPIFLLKKYTIDEIAKD